MADLARFTDSDIRAYVDYVTGIVLRLAYYYTATEYIKDMIGEGFLLMVESLIDYDPSYNVPVQLFIAKRVVWGMPRFLSGMRGSIRHKDKTGRRSIEILTHVPFDEYFQEYENNDNGRYTTSVNLTIDPIREVEASIDIGILMAVLEEVECSVIKGRMNDETYAVLSKKLGYSHEGIRLIEHRALRKMRKAVKLHR